MFNDYLRVIEKHVRKSKWNKISSFELNRCMAGAVTRLWPDFVCLEKRMMSEIPFLLSHIKDKNAKILDACLGSGATTIGLKIAGIENIVSNEIIEDYILVAQKEAKKYGVSLDIRSRDWRELGEFQYEDFDEVLCLGNSLTVLLDENDRKTALSNFKYVLKPSGKLIIDERNYFWHFLNGNFKYSGDVLYCGKDKVSAKPIFISESMVLMEYEHKQTGEKAHMDLYPFKENELRELLIEAGFKDIEIYGDYKKNFKPEEPEFLTYVCTK